MATEEQEGLIDQFVADWDSYTYAPKTTPTRANRTGDTQGLPTINGLPSVQSAVIADIEERIKVGIQRYGTALQPFNDRDALQDWYEEMIDGAMYAKQRIIERDTRLQEHKCDDAVNAMATALNNSWRVNNTILATDVLDSMAKQGWVVMRAEHC